MPTRRAFLFAAGTLALAGCGAPKLGVYESTAVPAPQWRRGDRWTYRRTDFYTKFNLGTYTREVMSADAQGIHVVTRMAGGQLIDDAMYSAPGVQLSGTLSEDGPIRGAFAPPLLQYSFPLASGKEWGHSGYRTDANGTRRFFSGSTTCQGWESIDAAGREARALVIRRAFNLGPKDEFHGPTTRYEVEWYVPEIGGPARLDSNETYYDTPGQNIGIPMTGNRFINVLTAFQRGPG